MELMIEENKSTMESRKTSCSHEKYCGIHDRGEHVDHGIHDQGQKINDNRENQTDHGIHDRGDSRRTN